MTNKRTYRTDSYFNEMYNDVLEYIEENIELADYTEAISLAVKKGA